MNGQPPDTPNHGPYAHPQWGAGAAVCDQRPKSNLNRRLCACTRSASAGAICTDPNYVPQLVVEEASSLVERTSSNVLLEKGGLVNEDGWTCSDTSCYIRGNTNTWGGAQLECAAHGSGAYIVTISDAAENEVVESVCA